MSLADTQEGGDATEAKAVAADSSTTAVAAAPPTAGFVPRALKKRPTSTRSHLALPSRPTGVAPDLPKSNPNPTPTTLLPTRTLSRPPSHSPQEIQRLETILTVIESSFSNHGLSLYRSSELFDKFHSGVKWIHLSQVLSIAPVRALTSTLVDLRDAVKLRDSHIVEVDETGYQIARRRKQQDRLEDSLDELDRVEPADWDDLTVYFDNIPFNTSLNSIVPTEPTTFSIVQFLSAALSTTGIEKLVVPALYDPKQPELSLTESDREDLDDEGYGGDVGSLGGGESSQAEAFRASLRAKQVLEAGQGDEQDGEGGPARREKKRARGLPRGGGPFKGFGFVVFDRREEVERILEEWGRERDRRGDQMQVEGEEEVDKENEDESGKGKGKLEATCRDKAKKGGMSAMRYSRWIQLKKEYLAYRRTLETLLEAQAEGQLDQLRNPIPPVLAKDQPPHLRNQRQEPPAQTESTVRPSKRASSPSFSSSYEAPSTTHNNNNNNNKRAKRASSPNSTPVTRHTRKLRTPSPVPGSTSGAEFDLSSDVALSIQGAYPQGCVVWVRNVHEKSSKTSLKTLFGKLLDELQEGSGKGVEFVDYEKGLDTCYIRFSSGPLATLTESHFLSTLTYHLTPLALSPVDSLSGPELVQAHTDLRRPLAVELLKGERERQYWASLPETTRKAARLAAGGKVGLVKEPRGFNNTGGAAANQGLGLERAGQASGRGENLGGARNDGEPSRKRKKPSRM